MKKLLCFILMFGIVGCQNENERTLQKNDTDILKITSSSQNNKELSEMITDDLVLTKENSPYDLNGNTIQVARGVTVTIDPGVEVKNGSIKLWGDLKAIGTETEKITFNGVTLNLESWEISTVYIDHATIISRSGSYFYRSFVNGSFTLKNSTLKGGTVNIYSPTADSLIENNLFTEGSTLDITSTYRKTTVRRNTFYNQDSKADILYNFTNMNMTNLLIEENNFLVPNKIAVRMQNTSSGTTVHAKNNYWGTDNDEVIQSMIHDGKDSLEDNAIVDYQPFLTEAVAEAPLIQILKAPITNKVTENSTEVTGSSEVGTTIILTNRGTVIGTGVTSEDGTFNISIPGQTANSIIEVVAKDNKGNESVSMKVVVEKTEPEEIDEFSGIISKDIILTKENSPYDLNGNTIQVARGVTVTINPGVEIKNGSIKLWGDLKAIGTETEKITFNGVTLHLTSWENSTVYIDHANITSRSGYQFYRSFLNGSFTLKNSVLKGGILKVYEPEADSLIENNLFTEGSTLDITSTYRKTTVRRNTFYNQDSKEDILYNFTNMNTTNLLIEENNFLVPNKIAVRMQNTSSGTTVHAKNNYWGTDNDEVIQSMIHDGKDSLEDNAIVDYQPFLTETVAEAPSMNLLQPEEQNPEETDEKHPQEDEVGNQQDNNEGFSVVRLKDLPPKNPERLTDVSGHWAEEDINQLTERGIITGYNNSTFRPKQNITRAEVMVIISRILTPFPEEVEQWTFNDYAPNWAKKAIIGGHSLGLINGYPSNEFGANDEITRAELVVILNKLVGLANVELDRKPIEVQFKDDIPYWASDAVANINQLGIVTGYNDDTFRPHNNASRAEVATVLSRILNGKSSAIQ